MDSDKLKQLRSRWADRDVFDVDDPVLAKAARDARSADGKRSLPYSGVPTLLGLPYTESAADLDIALVGVPMDSGVSNRSGAGFGPRAVRTIESIGPYRPTFRGIPKSRARVADIGDAHCDTMGAYDGSKFHHGGPASSPRRFYLRSWL